MRKFDTNVQYIKYRVLTEVARAEFEDRLAEHMMLTPELTEFQYLVNGDDWTVRLR